MSHNRATIYSNGIAELHRVFSVSKKGETKISIPVRQQHLADVLASLTISDKVKIDSPPSFQPANVDDGNLHIDTQNALISIASQLAGANVTVFQNETEYVGRLIGHQDQTVALKKGESVREKHLVVMVDNAIRRIPLKEVNSVQFTDPVIQAEIDKALSRKLRDIKPNSTFVDLELSTSESSTEAIVQYTIPAAAWKISYRIILLENKKIEFHGHAIVDNNTDEDWKDFVIAVVMGQPITFTSDLADSKTPHRSHVNIVQDSAIGAVEVEEMMMDRVMMAAGGGAGGESADAEVMRILRESELRELDRAKMRKRKAPRPAKPAAIETADVTETGDFCIFESAYPVSIDARRSAVIPVFQTELDNSNAVLHYKQENHPDRPYRAIRFLNSLDHSLGRGICTVFDEATYAGSCIVPAMKEGEDALLPHALEMGVKVKQKVVPTKSRRIGIRVSDGVAVESHHNQSQTEYQIRSSSESTMPMVLDHNCVLADSKIECCLLRPNGEPVTLETGELSQGRRIEFDLQAKDEVVISISETKVRKSQVRLIENTPHQDLRVTWLYENFVDADSTVVDNPNVKQCVELQRTLDEVNQQISHAQNEISRLTQRQERLRKNIQSGGGEQTLLRWQNDLGKAEDAIVQLEEQRTPELIKQRDDIREQLFNALRTLTLDWAE